jgi:hypothetical protein
MLCAPDLGRTAKVFLRPQRHVDTVFLHCSATGDPEVSAERVDTWHRDRGWSCIGYHYFIQTDGKVQYGRSLERSPAAQAGYNTGTIAICLNGLDKADFTDAQYQAVRALCREIDRAYGGQMRFRGHREVSAKACPVFDYRSVLNLDPQGHMTKADTVRPRRVQTFPLEVQLPILREMDTHPGVYLCRLLLNDTAAIEDVGVGVEVMDKRLVRRVRDFQEDNNLSADGICGPETWAELLDVGS